MISAERAACFGCSRMALDPDIGLKCEAFPDGVPEGIYATGFDHKTEYPGDRGVLFEKKN